MKKKLMNSFWVLLNTQSIYKKRDDIKIITLIDEDTAIELLKQIAEVTKQ